jgi:hypothetical protein
VEFGCVAFADVDNDADLDLFLTGYNTGPSYPDWYSAILYINGSQSGPDPLVLEEEDPLPGFIVYPNPAKSSDQINIGYDYRLTGTIEFSVLDSNGRVVLKGRDQLEYGNDHTEINLTSLKDGLYYLKVQHCELREVLRLIVD